MKANIAVPGIGGVLVDEADISDEPVARGRVLP